MNENKKSGLSEFQRYIRGEMTKREENAFQRKLQRDPFAEEATEGFAGISPWETAEDMDHLKNKLKKRIRSRKRIFYYRIAASVAVLMVLSSVYLVIRQTRPSAEITNLLSGPVTMDIHKPEVINEPVITDSVDNQIRLDEMTEQKGVAENQDNITVTGDSEQIEMVLAGVKAEEAENIDKEDEDINMVLEKMAAPAAPVSEMEPVAIQVKGRIISSEDNQPVPGASVIVKGTDRGVITDTGGNFNINLSGKENLTLVASYIGMEPREFQAADKDEVQIRLQPSPAALTEVVVVGYGAKKSKSAPGEIAVKQEEYERAGYAPPVPADGQENFSSYIEENMQRPLSLASGQKAVVVVSFIVRSTGNLDSLNVIRSPGDEYSREAIRLINEGPSWKPAESNGKRIDEEVRIRIVFK